MLCEQCQERPASFHITRTRNGKKVEVHICETCAQENDVFSDFNIQGLLGSMFEQQKVWGAPTPGTRCPTCNLSLMDVQKRGQLGCSDCYDTFRREVGVLLRRIHGTNKHVGKIPAVSQKKTKLMRQLEDLREELKGLVHSEKYEQAATVRDEIRRLEQEAEQKGDEGNGVQGSA